MQVLNIKVNISVKSVYSEGKLRNLLWPCVNILLNTYIDSFKTEAMVTAQKPSLHWPQANRKNT